MNGFTMWLPKQLLGVVGGGPGLVKEKLLGMGIASVGLQLGINPSLRAVPTAAPEMGVYLK